MIDLPWLQTHIHTHTIMQMPTHTHTRAHALTHTNTLFSDKLLF